MPSFSKTDFAQLRANISATFPETYGRTLQVPQERINLFAEATDDHQWPHVDTVRAAIGCFHTTVAHGFLVLGLLSALRDEESAIVITDARRELHVGGGYQLLLPLKSGWYVRARQRLAAVESAGKRLLLTYAYQIRGGQTAESMSKTIAEGTIKLLYD